MPVLARSKISGTTSLHGSEAKVGVKSGVRVKLGVLTQRAQQFGRWPCKRSTWPRDAVQQLAFWMRCVSSRHPTPTTMTKMVERGAERRRRVSGNCSSIAGSVQVQALPLGVIPGYEMGEW